MKYQAIASHWNGACYSTDGEEYADFESLNEAKAAADGLAEMYNTDPEGEPCDVDIQWEIYEVDEDGEQGEMVEMTKVSHSVGKAAQDACEIIAKRENEYSTDYVGTNADDELVTWLTNGGSRGAYDRMDWNKGEWVEIYDVPAKIDQLEWLKLAVEYGCDDVDELMVEEIDLSDLEWDADTDEAHWLDAEDGLFTMSVYSVELGSGKRLAWSNCDDAGIDDVVLIPDSKWSGFAEEIAGEIGKLVDVETGEHYTSHGVQYQHHARGFYDRDGYRIVVVPRDAA